MPDDDEVDEELLELLRDHLGLNGQSSKVIKDTRVLRDAEYICDNAIDVAVDSTGTKAAASMIWSSMEKHGYLSRNKWCEHELHPKTKDEASLNFIFTMDLLNFCFWPEDTESGPFMIRYHEKEWTGYWSLVAVLQRALDESMCSACWSTELILQIFPSLSLIFGRTRTNAQTSF